MASTRAPKQWCLTKVETVNSFESWKQNLQYTLSLDKNFAQFLVNDMTWEKKTKGAPLRGFCDDGNDMPVEQRLTAQQKVTMLELMLGQIANYCSVISRSTIVKQSTSMDSIWQAIRTHYGFQSTGAHFIDFSDIQLEANERPEDLYQRLMAFVEDNLLQKEGSITHYGDKPNEDEELSPSLENLVVLTWLRLVDRNLPRLVKQRYGTELRSKTLASIKPEISQALDSLLDELKATEETRVMRTAPTVNQRRFPTHQSKSSKSTPWKTRPQKSKLCPLCKQAGRSEFYHYLSTCQYLPESDRNFLTKARQISAQDDSLYTVAEDTVYDSGEDDTPSTHTDIVSSASRRVQTKQSPYLKTFFHHHPVCITIDSGAETNMVRASVASYIGAKITKSSQIAIQADGQSQLVVVGETRMVLSREGKQFILEALVVESLDVDVLGGVPFMNCNDISVRPAKQQIILGDGTIYTYGPEHSKFNHHSARRAQVLRSPESTTIWPGEFIEIDLPIDISESDSLALEPRTILRRAMPSNHEVWPSPHITSSVGTKIRIPNMTGEPQVLRKDEHFCHVHHLFSPCDESSQSTISDKSMPKSPKRDINCTSPHSSAVKLNPDNVLPKAIQDQFHSLLLEFDDVFDSKIEGYNGAFGQFESIVNMGPVQPPQRKGRIPQYSRDKLLELQQKIDDLENQGVFQRPEEAGIVVEYLNPSFLVKKPNGGFRLVTAFADVGRYSKPQPSLMPDVDSTLRTIACWKYIIASDLTNAFYQIPLSKESKKYCGIVTPFRGVRVYARTAMGMPGSETALEELMSRVLGDLLQEGVVAKLADDLYCGGDTPQQLLQNWRRILMAFQKSGLKLSPQKTIIAPKTITILGWIWSQGTIQGSPHRIATLTSCPTPSTVHAMRSFVGAYKVLARVIPDCAKLLAPLEDAIAGRQSQEKVIWTSQLYATFATAQKSLSSNKTITLPCPDDNLWIVTDGSVKSNGIGATLYVVRDGKPRLAGFFSAKLRKRQVTWLPCEIEALGITAAVKHFSPYIIQSRHFACILTDSKPCVQAYEKLARGEFLSSPRVSTFLTTVSRYQVTVQHLAGNANVPSDFASRNAPDCNDPECQLCRFIVQAEDSVVRHISLRDIISGDAKLPFTSRAAWAVTQLECPDLRRTHAHLVQGTRPSKKLTNIKDVKRYLNVATIAKDGLLVVKRKDPIAPSRECIVVPRQALDGLLTALHIKLGHPTCHQLKTVAHRYLYALDMDSTISRISNNCHLCASLKKVPQSLICQSTNDPPDALGISFAADVIKHLCPLDGPDVVVRTDGAPGFVALVNDRFLQQHRISLEIGRTKNINKNPVAEKAIQEVEDELLRHEPDGGIVSARTLAIVIARLNSRIRSTGLSARELWTRRDQFTNEQLPVLDQQAILHQHDNRIRNHTYSERSKAPLRKTAMTPAVEVGDLVYLLCDRNKSRARDWYLVVSMEGVWCNIRKFTGSQLRKTSYRVKRSECYIVPTDPLLDSSSRRDSGVSDEDEEVCSETFPSSPSIPVELSTPQTQPPPINSSLAPVARDDARPVIVPTSSDACATFDSHTSREDNHITDFSESSPKPRRSSRPKSVPKYLDSYIT